MWALGRNKKVYGEDVERFRPERYLEATPEQLLLFQKADMSFGAGMTTCLGKHIAMFEIYKTIVELFRNFEIELADPFHPCKIENIFAFFIDDMNVFIKPRSNKASA
ncbi:cytochrome P450 [Aspergillus homomorphus CBS 101889]|uniref:Cytochrome P450 n=1 Tax=Aspergillus homomorphus (strain CBS 101889) TaxID=1450537 RepID=A0A395HG57_ASPHC|nr:cytochrome P450 [Aspergillus homomorphus CBS 101889]RAL06489.1 cytochrome P450 [Aspergillus homomorphus CBS 101889]